MTHVATTPRPLQGPSFDSNPPAAATALLGPVRTPKPSTWMYAGHEAPVMAPDGLQTCYVLKTLEPTFSAERLLRSILRIS